MIVSSLLYCMLSSPFPKWTLFGAPTFGGDLLREFCLPGGSVGVSDEGLAVVGTWPASRTIRMLRKDAENKSLRTR
jgi:hypothetical protein